MSDAMQDSSNLGPRRFRPSWVISIVTVCFCALTISLGNWQTRRAHEKEALQYKLDQRAKLAPITIPTSEVNAEDFDRRPVYVRGSYDAAHSILLDNKVYQGRVGYQVLTPLRIGASERYVLVDRGWVAAGRTRQALPQIQTPSGEQKIEGMAVLPSAKIFELARDETPGKVWQNLVLARYAKWSGLKLQPVVIEQHSAAADGLVRDWPRPDVGIERHRSYALQWYSFCALAVLFYVALNFKRTGVESKRDD
jgi:surfeit locus 1 family protein